MKDSDIMRRNSETVTSGKILNVWDVTLKNNDNHIEHIYINAETGEVMGGNM